MKGVVGTGWDGCSSRGLLYTLPSLANPETPSLWEALKTKISLYSKNTLQLVVVGEYRRDGCSSMGPLYNLPHNFF